MLTAKERWERLTSKRQAVLERARDCAALTIPALVPPEAHDDNNVLPTPYQSLGARGVNNVASKLLMSLFPPGGSFLRLQIDPRAREELGEKKTEVEQALAKQEKLISAKIDTMAARPTLFECFKHLVSAGNVLMNLRKGAMRMYRIDQYVISRRADGAPVEAVIKECVPANTLSPELRLACEIKEEKDEKIDVFTVIEWGDLFVTDYQEINGKRVPNTTSVSPIKRPSWFALRWQAVPGCDYGRGLVEEYLGDLKSLEGLSESLVRFAAAASKIVFMVKPGSTTRFEDIQNAESGDAIVGQRSDVDILQMEKYADFQVTKTTADNLELRLSHAFLLRSGTTRNAERVTAEEIRAMAQELEDVLGGVYTVQSVELQLPLARHLIHIMQQAQEIPALPEKAVQPVIITGFEALGRNHSVNRLRAWVADVKQVDPDGGASTLNWRNIDRALGVGHGVEDLDQFVLSPEEIEANRQADQQAAIAAQAIGPAATVVAKTAAEGAQAPQ
jgi:hypothetical protein